MSVPRCSSQASGVTGRMIVVASLVAAMMGCSQPQNVPLDAPPFTVSADGRTFGLDIEAADRMEKQIKAVGGEESLLMNCHDPYLERDVQPARRPSEIEACMWQYYVEHVRPLIERGAVKVEP